MTAHVALAVAIAALSTGQGKQLYGQYCISCHGANGEGVAQARTIGGAPQRIQEQQSARGPSLRGVGALAADFYLRTGYMPLHRIGDQPRRSRVLFSDLEIRDLVAYIASLGSGPAIPRPQPQLGNLAEGLHLFTDHCAGCHQVVAQGGVVTGALPPALDDATDVQIAEAVRIGPYVMPKFSETAITNTQLNSIVRYVDWIKHPDNRGGWAIGDIGPVPEGLVTWFLAAALLVALCVVVGKRLKRA
ncbi:MAG: c-type cytochrome [Acidobacteriota bacterium]|nr:c-type cytochrome [Acidobacteriota bacterium]